MMQEPAAEARAADPETPATEGFNPNAELPYGLKTEHVRQAMTDFAQFIGFVNRELTARNIERLESMLMPANFSSIVGEFMTGTIPRYCPSLAKNQYHNGHPDLVPRGRFPRDAAQHEEEGIEVKGSRYPRGWQGHNPEDCWLMVFVFEANRPSDPSKGIPPRAFRFLKVVGARLVQDDWLFSGRSGTSRRTITASVRDSGYQKMEANWIYRAAKLPSATENPVRPEELAQEADLDEPEK